MLLVSCLLLAAASGPLKRFSAMPGAASAGWQNVRLSMKEAGLRDGQKESGQKQDKLRVNRQAKNSRAGFRPASELRPPALRFAGRCLELPRIWFTSGLITMSLPSLVVKMRITQRAPQGLYFL